MISGDEFENPRWVLQFKTTIFDADKPPRVFVMFVESASTACFCVDDAMTFPTSNAAKVYAKSNGLWMMEPERISAVT